MKVFDEIYLNGKSTRWNSTVIYFGPQEDKLTVVSNFGPGSLVIGVYNFITKVFPLRLGDKIPHRVKSTNLEIMLTLMLVHVPTLRISRT